VDPTSEFELGKYAEFSELDDEKAAAHYQSAAKRGHLLAQLKMAHLLTAGFLKPAGDTSEADAEARLYLDMAIMMHDSPEAMVFLANMSFTADNQKRKWLAEAAARLDYPPVRCIILFRGFILFY
jgi:TPR repeat protein